jgi:hypothetical protein
MIGLIEWENTWLKLRCCFHGTKHGVENMIIERLSSIEFDYLLSMILCYLLLKMF